MTDGTDRVPRLRTDAEREAFAAATRYAAAHDLAAPPETAYLDALPAARSVVLRRLVRGLVRGRPPALPEPRTLPAAEVGPAVRSSLPSESGGRTAATYAAEDVDSSEDEPGVDDPTRCSSDRFVLLSFPSSEAVVGAPIAAVHGYDRLRLSGPVRRWTPTGRSEIDHPVALVAPLRREGAFSDDEQAARIEVELAESVANLALARVGRRVHRRRVESDAAVLEDGPGVPAADGPSGLERLVTDGHPIHPSAKIRRGMSATAALSYAPAFTDSIDLRFVAVRSDRARRTSVDDRTLTDRLFDAFDGLAGAVARAVPVDREAYAVVPVHPWQYYHVIPDRYAEQIDDDVVVPIPDTSRPATPLLNLRTVVPEPTPSTDAPPHCKLAIGVQLTNVERTVSPQAVHNGPQVTALLRAVATREELSRLGFLDETAAACYYPPDGPHATGDAYDDVRHLAGLVRSNPRSHRLVGDDATVVPAASLVADSPATGRPLVREAVERYAEATDATDLGDATRAFVDDYVRAVVPDQLRLLSTYGIALESHLQNTAVVFEAGEPTACLVRDFGGIRIHRDRLADRGLSIDPYPDSDLEADGEGDLYRKLYYALFQNHLTELAVALARSTPIEESEYWELVRDHCRRAFDRVREQAVPAARIDRDEATLFAEPATHKALTAMRLEGKRHEYVTSPVSNPIAAPSGIDRSN